MALLEDVDENVTKMCLDQKLNQNHDLYQHR